MQGLPSLPLRPTQTGERFPKTAGQGVLAAQGGSSGRGWDRSQRSLHVEKENAICSCIPVALEGTGPLLS